MGSAADSLNQLIDEKAGVIKKNAPFQPLTPIQDEEEEEIVSLASSFDNEVDPFEVEQEPVYDFDTTKVLGRNKYGGALLRSKWSDEDNAIDAARTAAGFTMPSNNNIKPSDRLGDMASVSYSEGMTFDTAEEALSGLPSYLSSITEQRVVTDEEFNTRNYDPSEFAMSGVSAKGGVSSRAATDSTASYINNNNIPLSIEVDGQTRYLTTGLGADVYTKADEDFDYQAGSYEDFGPVGTYSTIHVKPESVWAGLPVPLRIGLAIGTGGVSEAAIAATKLAAGETLHAMDYVSIALPSLEYAGILTKPLNAAKSAQAGTDAMNAANAAGAGNAMAAGSAAQSAALAGKGILGLSYNASKALITGVATGNVKTAIVTAYAPKVVEKVLSQIGADGVLDAFAAEHGLQADDLNDGLTRTITSLGKGKNLEDSLLDGLSKYVREGGTIPDSLKDILKSAGSGLADLLGPVEDALSSINKDFIKPLTSGTGDFLSDLDTEFRKGLSEFDDKALQPWTQAIGDKLSTVDTEVRKGLSEFDDKALQPWTRTIGDKLSKVDTEVRKGLSEFDDKVVNKIGDGLSDLDTEFRKGLSEFDDKVVNKIGDKLSEVDTAVRKILTEIPLPEIPNIDPPGWEGIDLSVWEPPRLDIDLPELPEIPLPTITLPPPKVAVGPPSATRTTGGLFDVSQFEHEEGISLVGNLLTGLTSQDAKKLSKKQSQQPEEEREDILSDPFANIFNYKV